MKMDGQQGIRSNVRCSTSAGTTLYRPDVLAVTQSSISKHQGKLIANSSKFTEQKDILSQNSLIFFFITLSFYFLQLIDLQQWKRTLYHLLNLPLIIHNKKKRKINRTVHDCLQIMCNQT